VLIHYRVNGHGSVNARQLMPGLVISKGLNDRDGAVLTIIGIPAPPNHAEDLAGTEVVHAVSLPFFMVIRWRAEAQAIQLRAGNVTSDESGQANRAQTTPPSQFSIAISCPEHYANRMAHVKGEMFILESF
jgi:hypothetical protein